MTANAFAGGAVPILYDELAPWWPRMSAPEEYAEEAAIYSELLVGACRGGARTLLELGSGGGNNASHMKHRFDVTLVELMPGMIEVSRELNPELAHHQGDMRTVRLDTTFDCVFIHDAICYMTNETDLRAAIETARVHCRPGGAILLAPDFLRETFREATDCGGAGAAMTGLRYLEWMWDPDPSDTTYTVDYVYALRDGDGNIRTLHDRHLEGLFSRETWLRLMDEAGLDARAVAVEHSEIDPGSYEIFVGTVR